MKHTLEYVIGKKIAIYCPTQEEWDQVTDIICSDNPGRIGHKDWDTYKEQSCICPSDIGTYGSTYGDIKYFETYKYEIITYAEFMACNTPEMDYTQEYQKLEELEKQKAELEKSMQSLKESIALRFKVGDWVWPLAESGEGIRNEAHGRTLGRAYQLVEMPSTPGGWIRMSNECGVKDGNGAINPRDVRLATPAEIASAQTKTILLGSNKIPVVISKGRIVTKSNIAIDIKDAKNVLSHLTQIDKCHIGDWNVSVLNSPLVRIGCSEENHLFSKADFLSIVTEYYKINTRS